MRLIFLLIAIAFISCNKQQESTSGVSQNEVQVHQAKLALEFEAKLGEGALWDAASQQLFWVDIEGKELHTYNPISKKNQRYALPSRVGTVVSVGDGMALVALEDGIYTIDLDSTDLLIYSDIHDTEVPSRYNDGKVDPNGNLWVGSMPLAQDTATGKLYRFQPDGSHEIMHRNIGISNGIVWTKDGSTMYFIDTQKGNITAFDYNLNDSSIANERVVVNVPEELGFPDGMAIDENDRLWVGLWNGGAVAHYDPANGRLLSIVKVPAHNATSCAFGGKNLDQLFITTASVDMTAAEKRQFPLAGSIFVVNVGVNGVESVAFGGE
jgi:sugar lactone lactonase YvrE